MTAALAADSLAGALADRVMDAAITGPSHDWAPVDGGLRELLRLKAIPLEVDLAVSALRIAVTGGDVPLLGTDLRSAPYPALLWNGARCSRAGMGPAAALTLVALVVGQNDEAGSSRLVQSVRAGLAIRDSRSWPGERVVAPTAAATTDVISVAACAAVSAGMGSEDVSKVLDIAGSLMTIKPARPVGSTEMSGQWSGHALAAGWLAVQLHRAGVSGMSGGLEHTLACVIGLPSDNGQGRAAPFGPVEGLLGRPPSTVNIRQIVELLG